MLRETLTPPSVVCYYCAQNTVPCTMHPAFSSTVATFQKRLGIATGGSSMEERTWNSVLHRGSVAWSMGWPLCPSLAQSLPFLIPFPLKKDVPTRQPCCRLMKALLSGSSFLVFCLPEGIMDLLILFHWLVKEHNRIMMGKGAGSGRGLSKGWREARI